MPYTNEEHHCGAKPGQPHKFWDDVARCYWTGVQLIQCGAWNDEDSRDHDCSPSIWDGDYPGIKQCRKYGLYTEVIQLDGSYKISEDLNLLYSRGTWNINTQQHEIP